MQAKVIKRHWQATMMSAEAKRPSGRGQAAKRPNSQAAEASGQVAEASGRGKRQGQAAAASSGGKWQSKAAERQVLKGVFSTGYLLVWALAFIRNLYRAVSVVLQCLNRHTIT